MMQGGECYKKKVWARQDLNLRPIRYERNRQTTKSILQQGFFRARATGGTKSWPKEWMRVRAQADRISDQEF
ncbi:MAG: hypothetical protein COB53_06200 [Elusimicrobia bacterium]|nr:MAG: hypothetical protein COB53_06200 [Elusimicrobiota bacterium]